MFTFLFYSMLVLGLGIAVLTFRLDSRWLWLAGLLLYGASFLGGFSIGLYLLVLPFTFWFLAAGYSFGRIKNFKHRLAFASTGIIVWFVCVSAIDDYWLFLPFHWMF